jgi:hypothetical protein
MGKGRCMKDNQDNTKSFVDKDVEILFEQYMKMNLTFN